MAKKTFATTTKLASGALLVACTALAVGVLRHRSVSASHALSADDVASSKAGGADSGLTPHGRAPTPPTAALAATYQLEYSTRVATTSGQPMTSFQLSGPLLLSGFVVGQAATVRAVFNGTFNVDTSADGAEDANLKLEAAARKPFQLEFDADGTFLRASGQPGTPSFVGRIWTALGEYIQITGMSGKAKWEAHEHDASGQYLAAYDKRDAGPFSKKKLRYEQVSAKALTGYEVIASQEQFALDDRGQLASVDLSESTRAVFGAGGPLPNFEATTKLGLARTSTGASAANSSLDGAFAPFDQLAREENAAARDANMVGKMTLADALTQIQAFEHSGGDGAQRQRAGRAFAALTAMLRRDPNALVAVRANLAKGGPLTETLLGALRDASTPETQKLLAELSAAHSPLSPDQRLEAARCLSRVTTPDAETVQALEALRSDPTVGTQATYGLGTALHHLQQTDSALATTVRDTLTSQLAGTSDPGSQVAVLTSLGNAGDPTTLDVIRRYVGSAEPTVRAAAAQALRRIPGPDADALLSALCADPVANVRYSAADASGERASSAALSAALSILALKETALQVRAKSVNVLAQWYPTEPALAATLQAVARGDSNADLRNVAKTALGQG